MGLMYVLARIGSTLAQMPTTLGGAVNAGLTFAVPRNLHSLAACTGRSASARETAVSLGSFYRL